MSGSPPETARSRREIGGSLGAEQRGALETITGRRVSILVGEAGRARARCFPRRRTHGQIALVFAQPNLRTGSASTPRRRRLPWASRAAFSVPVGKSGLSRRQVCDRRIGGVGKDL